MYGNDENMLFSSQFKFGITFQLIFLNIYLLMVQTLNETAIYLIKILTQHEMAPNTFYK